MSGLRSSVPDLHALSLKTVACGCTFTSSFTVLLTMKSCRFDIKPLLLGHADRICPSSSVLLVIHLLHLFSSMLGIPLVLFTLVGKVPDKAWIKRILLPGVSSLCFHNQLHLCFEFNAVVRAFPLFCCSRVLVKLFITFSFLSLAF